MDLFIILIKFLNDNAGAFSALLSLLSLVVAIIAIWSTLYTSKKQQRLQLLEERYKILARFSKLINLAENLTSESLAYKGRMMLWNCNSFGVWSDNAELGAKIFELDTKLENLDPDSEEAKQISSERKKLASKKLVLDVGIAYEDKDFLERSRLLFSDEITTEIAKFLGIYLDFVLCANFEDEETMKTIFTMWRDQCKEIKMKKIIDKMDQYIDFTK